MSRPDRRGFVLLLAMLVLALAGALVLTAHALAVRELAAGQAWRQAARLMLSAESALERTVATWPAPWHDPTAVWPPLPDSGSGLAVRLRLSARRVGDSVLDLEAVATPVPGPPGPARRAGLLVRPVLRNDSVVAARPISSSAWRELPPPRR